MTESLPIPAPDDPGEFLLYQTADGRTRIEVRFSHDSLWLSQKAMAELFQKDVRTINEHLRNIFEESELGENAVVRKFRITAADGKMYETLHYNLDAILSVGYRVRSHRGTQFRIWATERLREYLIKGFTLDDERLARAGAGNYFEELLARIRDIRSSERVFWRKVLDIYATSIDYDPGVDASLLFFKTVQNKMHWAVHGQTAAELIHSRADASKANMGLMTWEAERPRKSVVSIAKNYLKHDELDALNRIVSAYLEFAELQALNRKPMYMSDWITKLDDFLRLSEREILTHAGKISHDVAKEKAEAEFVVFRRRQDALPQPVDEHFTETLDELKKLESRAKESKKRKANRKKRSDE